MRRRNRGTLYEGIAGVAELQGKNLHALWWEKVSIGYHANEASKFVQEQVHFHEIGGEYLNSHSQFRRYRDGVYDESSSKVRCIVIHLERMPGVVAVRAS
jgi:hypothetical protein